MSDCRLVVIEDEKVVFEVRSDRIGEFYRVCGPWGYLTLFLFNFFKQGR